MGNIRKVAKTDGDTVRGVRICGARQSGCGYCYKFAKVHSDAGLEVTKVLILEIKGSHNVTEIGIIAGACVGQVWTGKEVAVASRDFDVRDWFD